MVSAPNKIFSEVFDDVCGVVPFDEGKEFGSHDAADNPLASTASVIDEVAVPVLVHHKQLKTKLGAQTFRVFEARIREGDKMGRRHVESHIV